MTTDCDISVIHKKQYSVLQLFPNMSKNMIKLNALGLKPKSILLNVDDVQIMNLQTYRKSIVKHQYGKNFSTLSFSLKLGGG